MPVSLKHTKVSAKADGLDGALVQPSDWNDEHTLTMASARMLGRTTAGVGAVEELDAAAVRAFADVAQDGIVDIDERDDTYTFSLSDRGKLILYTDTDTVTFTIPTNASVAFPIGTRITIIQTGSGQVSIAPVSGTVTLNSISSRRKISARYGEVRLYKTGTNTWNLSGDIAA